MKSVQQQPATPELLTVDQFAQRLQVSRATVFVWIQKNILARGKHYLKIGRVLRFLWSMELFDTLSPDTGTLLPAKTTARPQPCKKSSALNWDY